MPDPASRPLKDRDRFGLAKHGIAGPRGQVAPLPARDGRFGRMFPQLAPADLSREQLSELIQAMTGYAGVADPTFYLPAGYTYLCQFVDHDLTFDPNSRLQTSNDPYTLVDYRTPRLDLDSVYGSGPMDQPFLYRWSRPSRGVELLLSSRRGAGGAVFHDLPRNAAGRALIGDARNDENRIISQLHTLFLRFHNLAVAHVRTTVSKPRAAWTFETAQRIVRWHYQWLVLNDVLPRIVGRTTQAAVLRNRGKVVREYFHWGTRPYMPVEFSGAAFRFGHSLVRSDYTLSDTQVGVPIMRLPAGAQPQLGGFSRLPPELVIDWRQFFPTDAAARDSTPIPQTAMRIDPSIARPLTQLVPDGANLVKLNLERGAALGLPSGQDVALAMNRTPLAREDIVPAEFDFEKTESAEAVRDATPLWLYILREADVQQNGEALGAVGGRIVAEVLVGLVQADPTSYLRQYPQWRPGVSVDGGRTPALRPEAPITEMADLIRLIEGRPPLAPRRAAASVVKAETPSGGGAAGGNGKPSPRTPLVR